MGTCGIDLGSFKGHTLSTPGWMYVYVVVCKIGAPFFGCPYNKSPKIKGPKLGPHDFQKLLGICI